MEEKIIKLKITDNTKEATKNAEDLKKEYEGIKAAVDKVDKSLQKVEQDVSDIGNATKSASSGLQRMGNGIRSISSNVKTIGLGLLVSQFNDFKEAISSSNDVADVYNNTLNATKKAASDFGKVVFSGNLTEKLKEGLKSILDGTAVEKVKKYAKETYSAGKNVTELVNDANMAAAKQSGIFENFDRQAEIERKTRDNQLLSFTQRIKASDKLKEILEEQTISMEAQADIQIKAKQAAFDLTGKREDQIALEEALNNKLGIQAQIQGLITEQDQARIGLLLEENDLKKQTEDLNWQIADSDAENTYNQIQNDFRRLKNLKLYYEEKANEETIRYKELIDKQVENSANRIQLENEFSQKMADINLKIERNDYELMLEQKRIDDVRLQNKLDFVSSVGSSIGALGRLFEQGTDASKAAALAEIAINTGVGFVRGLSIAQKSADAAGPGAVFAFPIFFAEQVAAVLGAASQAKSILESGNTNSGGGGSSMAVPQAQAPQFNVVGVSPINQAAQLMQNQEPIKAYVVSGDVSTAQSLDRNRISSATLG